MATMAAPARRALSSSLDAGIENHLLCRRNRLFGPFHDTDADPCGICRGRNRAERRAAAKENRAYILAHPSRVSLEAR